MKDKQQKIEKVKGLIQEAKKLLDIKLSTVSEKEMNALIQKNMDLISALKDAKVNLLNIPMLEVMIKELENKNNDIFFLQETKDWLTHEKVQNISSTDDSDQSAILTHFAVVHGIELKDEELKNLEPADQLRAFLNDANMEVLDRRISDLENTIKNYEEELGEGRDEEYISGIENVYKWLEMQELKGELVLMKEAKQLKENLAVDTSGGANTLRKLRGEFNQKVNSQEWLLDDMINTGSKTLEPGEKRYEEFKKRGGLTPPKEQAQVDKLRESMALLKVKIDFVQGEELKAKEKSSYEALELNELNQRLSESKSEFIDLRTEIDQLNSQIAKLGPSVEVGHLFQLDKLTKEMKVLASEIGLMMTVSENKFTQLNNNIEKYDARVEKLLAKNPMDFTMKDMGRLKSLKSSLKRLMKEAEGTEKSESIMLVYNKVVQIEWERYFIKTTTSEIVQAIQDEPEIENRLKDFQNYIQSLMENDKDVNVSELTAVDSKLNLAVVILDAREMLDYGDLYEKEKLEAVVSRLIEAKTKEENSDLVGDINSLITELKTLQLRHEEQGSSSKENTKPTVQDWVAEGKHKIEKVINQETDTKMESVKGVSDKNHGVK